MFWWYSIKLNFFNQVYYKHEKNMAKETSLIKSNILFKENNVIEIWK